MSELVDDDGLFPRHFLCENALGEFVEHVVLYGPLDGPGAELRLSVEENNNKWGTLYKYTWPNYDVWGNYLNEVQNLKNWLNQRFEWLKSEYDGM